MTVEQAALLQARYSARRRAWGFEARALFAYLRQLALEA